MRIRFACGTLVAGVLFATTGGAPAPDLAAIGRGPVVARAGALVATLAPPGPACVPQASLRPQSPLPAPGRMPAGSTMARIAERGYLVVGVLQDTFPFSFREESSQLAGFDVDIARDIAGAIFGDQGKVKFRLLHEVDRVPSVNSDQVDLVAGSLTVTCHRQQKVEFSTVYYQAGQRVLVNRGPEYTRLADLGDRMTLGDLAGKRVCAGRGTTSLGTILRATPKPIPVGEATETDCLMLLQLGEVDAISTDDSLLAGMAAQDRRTAVVGPRLTQEPYGVAIRKDRPDLVRFVNAVLEQRVHDGRWRASYERWLLRLGPLPAPPAPQYRD